ncbi:MAG: DUF4142 domain-containing protein [Bdellovibrionota bacterium]
MNTKTLFVSAIALTLSSLSIAETPAAKPAGLTDPQIAHIVVTANKIDIEAGNLAKSKTKNKAVLSFAKTMVTDHTSVNGQATALVTKLKVTPETNATSEALTKGAAANIATLGTLKDKAFDKAYTDHEVTYHEQVLSTIDTELIPKATNPELKALLEKTRPAIAAHLEHAKEMQKTLTK